MLRCTREWIPKTRSTLHGRFHPTSAWCGAAPPTSRRFPRRGPSTSPPPSNATSADTTDTRTSSSWCCSAAPVPDRRAVPYIVSCSRIQTRGEQSLDGAVLAGVRILIVEDSLDTRESIRILLKQRGAEVTAVSTAAEALEAAAQGAADVMLTDIALPDADGFDLLRRLRAQEKDTGGRLRAVAFTAFSSRDHQRRAL